MRMYASVRQSFVTKKNTHTMFIPVNPSQLRKSRVRGVGEGGLDNIRRLGWYILRQTYAKEIVEWEWIVYVSQENLDLGSLLTVS